MILNEMNFEAAAASNQSVDGIRSVINAAFWMWYKDNTEREIWTARFLFIQKTFRVRDLKPVFEALFGSETGL